MAQFDVDDFLHVNCSSNLTNSILKWFINDQEVQSEHLIAYHLNNEYPVLLLTMRLEETWFERYNELRLECRAIVYETVANFQRKLNVQIIDFHRRQLPTLTVKGRASSANGKQNINNGRTYNTGIHVHRNNNGYSDSDYRTASNGRTNSGSSVGSATLTELVPGTTRGSASLTILNPADEPNHSDLDYHQLNNHHNIHQLTYQRSPVPTSHNQQQHTRNGHRTNQRPTAKRKRKRPTNVNLFNQLDYELYTDGHSSVNSDDNENGIEANSLAANHCDSVQFVPILLVLPVLVINLFRSTNLI